MSRNLTLFTLRAAPFWPTFCCAVQQNLNGVFIGSWVALCIPGGEGQLLGNACYEEWLQTGHAGLLGLTHIRPYGDLHMAAPLAV